MEAVFLLYPFFDFYNATCSWRKVVSKPLLYLIANAIIIKNKEIMMTAKINWIKLVCLTSSCDYLDSTKIGTEI